MPYSKVSGEIVLLGFSCGAYWGSKFCGEVMRVPGTAACTRAFDRAVLVGWYDEPGAQPDDFANTAHSIGCPVFTITSCADTCCPYERYKRFFDTLQEASQ